MATCSAAPRDGPSDPALPADEERAHAARDPARADRAAMIVSGSADQVHLIIDSIPALAWSARADGCVEFCNQRWLDFTGLSAQQVVGTGWVVAIHPDDLEGLRANWRTVWASGEERDYQARMRDSAGAYRWFLFRASPLRDGSGKIVRWYGTNTDINDLKRAQEILRASAQSLRLIIDGIPGLVYTTSAAGEVELFNRPLHEYLGRTPEAFRGWADADTVHPDDRPRAVAAWRRAVESGGGRYDVEQRLRGTDGSYRWFHLRALSVHDTDGRIIRWYGLLTDVHDQKRAERRLRRAIRARYEAALAERNRIARDMHDGLLQDISGIGLQLGALCADARAAPESVPDRLASIVESVRHASRAARAAVVGIRGHSGSADLVSAVHREAQRLAAPAALTLSMSVRGRVRLVPTVVCDVALSFTHEAITNVVQHANARRVRVSVAFTSKRFRLTVSDDGSGLRVSRDDQRGADHFGLVGIRERASSIGAAFRVSSVPGGGTTLRLDAPIPV